MCYEIRKNKKKEFHLKTQYRCEFELHGSGCAVVSDAGIDDFMYGFWINHNWKFTKGSDAKIWIPPSMIRYIAKDSVPVE